jgi:hypothetical protein
MFEGGVYTVLVLNIWDLNPAAFQLCFPIPHYGSLRKSGKDSNSMKNSSF